MKAVVTDYADFDSVIALLYLDWTLEQRTSRQARPKSFIQVSYLCKEMGVSLHPQDAARLFKSACPKLNGAQSVTLDQIT